MTDDDLARMCSFCSTVVHPDDELHPATRPSYRLPLDPGSEPDQLCDFCYVSLGAAAWLAGAAYPGEFMALARTASAHANLLRADLRRFTTAARFPRTDPVTGRPVDQATGRPL